MANIFKKQSFHNSNFNYRIRELNLFGRQMFVVKKFQQPQFYDISQNKVYKRVIICLGNCWNKMVVAYLKVSKTDRHTNLLRGTNTLEDSYKLSEVCDNLLKIVFEGVPRFFESFKNTPDLKFPVSKSVASQKSLLESPFNNLFLLHGFIDIRLLRVNFK